MCSLRSVCHCIALKCLHVTIYIIGDAQLILKRESQSLQRSKNFYIAEDYDILIQSLRNTNHFNENTNEKRGLDSRALGTIGALPDFMRGMSQTSAPQTKSKSTGRR